MSDSKIVTIHWMDESKTAIRVIREDGNHSIHGFNIQDPVIKEMVDNYGIEKIDADTDHISERQAKWEATVKLVQNRLEAVNWDSEKLFGSTTVSTPISEQIWEEIDPEELFKIKLKIFDDATIKDVMTREEKSQIRKSTDIVEILGVYYQVREKAGADGALA